jgi:hypothetical protein
MEKGGMRLIFGMQIEKSIRKTKLMLKIMDVKSVID